MGHEHEAGVIMGHGRRVGVWAGERVAREVLGKGASAGPTPRSRASVQRAKERVDPTGHGDECPCYDCLRTKVLCHMPRGSSMDRAAQRTYYRKMRKDGVPKAEAMHRLLIEARLHALDMMR
jgi:hypothetical protein